MRFAGLWVGFLAISTVVAAEKSPELPPLPKAISSFGATVIDDTIYVYGGHAGKAHSYSKETSLGEFRRLNLKNPEKWESLPGGPGLQGLAVVSHRGKIYRIGGMQPQNAEGAKAITTSLTTCACYDPKTNRWEEIPSLPEPRSSHDAVVVGDQLFVFGGWDLQSGAKTVWHDHGLVMDLSRANLKWEPIKQPFQRRALTMTSFNNQVYIIAGLNPDGEIDLTVDIYNPKTNQWTQGPAIPGPIMNGFTPASAVLDGKLYLSGADARVFRLSEKQDQWEVVGKMETGRFVHRMVAHADRLVALGGASKNGNVARTESIEPACCGSNPNKVEVKDGQQSFCPVMTGVTVGAESKTIEYKGVKILLCCATCEKKFKADPEAYLNPAFLPQLGKSQASGRKLQQVYCPVYKDRVVSEKDPFVIYQGVKIHLFNQSAVKKFESNPEYYADVKLLPQLKK